MAWHADGPVGKKPVSRLLGQLSDGGGGKCVVDGIATALEGRVEREEILGEGDVV